ncbi:MAG: hypothetical protein HQ565_03935 [Bacteroidetes bacterium]|nr:hypothetical protein [Bacteroidota bacterium]
MKKLTFPLILMMALSLAIIISCDKENKTPAIDNNIPSEQLEKMTLYESLDIQHETSSKSYLNYAATLYAGDDIIAAAIPLAFSNPDAWTYYKFSGVAGDDIEINVVRITCEADPSYVLYFGTSESTDGISAMPYYHTNPDLTWITFRDDQLPRPDYCAGACFAYGDPGTDVTLPYTGWYTLAVFDYISCGDVSPLEYRLNIVGITGGTIVIDACDTYVTNQYLETAYMQELIDICAETAKNHGAFVRCVTHLTNDWKTEGLITGEEKGAIVECAATSGIPY